MKKLFVDVGNQKQVRLAENDHEHIAYSLRLKPGDSLTLCDGRFDYAAKIIEIKKKETLVEIEDMVAIDSEPEIEVTLFIAALKSDKLDYAVQKATELGVKAVVPFVSQCCAAKAESVREERLGKIALEAAKQCGRGFVPPVYPVVQFNEMLDLLKAFEARLFLYEAEEKTDLKSFLRGRKKERKIAVIIGPEGGFSLKEAEKLRTAAGTGLTLGRRILRAETAAVAAVAAVMYEYGEWRVKR